MNWIEVHIDTCPAALDDLCARLEGMGVTGLVVDDEADFKDFLKNNHQYWDYVDDELLREKKGLCRVTFYLSDDEDGRRQLADAEGIGLEDAGRRARYAFFEDVRRAEKADRIVTGHHLDDLSEDVLLRLVRGAGWPGLGGMKAVDPVRRLMRPLLGTPRATLEAFLRSLGVDWIEDASNRSEAFRRNRLRNHVLPLLRAENPSLSRSVRTLWELAREDERYWDAELAPVFAQLRREGGELLLPRAAFVGRPRAARLRVYAGLFSRFGRGQAQAETLFRLDEAAVASRSRKVFQFPGAVCIETGGEGLTVGDRAHWNKAR